MAPRSLPSSRFSGFRHRSIFVCVVLAVVLGVALLLIGVRSAGKPVGFVVGLDFPWLHYGEDIGNAERGLMDFRKELQQEFRRLVLKGYRHIRFWLFGDGRSGFKLSRDGKTILLASSVDEDMDALFEAARAEGIILYPVLLDFTFWDGLSTEDGNPIGEHADWITSEDLRQELLRCLLDLVKTYQQRYGDMIGFWDLVNEPCNGTALTEHPEDFSALSSFLSTLALRILAIPGTKISIGFRDRATVLQWKDILQVLDRQYQANTNRNDFAARFVVQFHYYRKHEANVRTRLQGFDVSELLESLDIGKAQVCLGEMDPFPPSGRQPVLSPRELQSAGFSSVFYWRKTAPNDTFPELPDVEALEKGMERVGKRRTVEDVPLGPAAETRPSTDPLCSLGLALKPDKLGERTILTGEVPADPNGSLFWLEEPASADVVDKVVTFEILPEMDLSLHHPGWYAHILLVDHLNRLWRGPAERLPTRGRRWLRLWVTPVIRPCQCYPEDTQVNLSKIAKVGFQVVPGYPSQETLSASLIVRGNNVLASSESLDRRHGLDLLYPNDEGAGICPCEPIDLVHNGTWTHERFEDAQGITELRLLDRELVAEVSLEKPHPNIAQGEIVLDLTSVEVPTIANERRIMEQGVLVDLTGCLVRLHLVSAVEEPSRNESGSGTTLFYKLAISRGRDRFDMPGEIKLPPGKSGWIQLWVPKNPQTQQMPDVLRKAHRIHLKAALDRDGQYMGKLTVDCVEVVPANEVAVAGNLLNRPFLCFHAETWGTDQGIVSCDVVRDDNGKSSVSCLADIRPGEGTRQTGRVVFDIRQNSSHLDGVDLMNKVLTVEIDWGQLKVPNYFVEVSLEDNKRNLGLFESATMMAPRQSIVRKISAGQVRTLGPGREPPELRRIARLFLKIGPNHGCKDPVQGAFYIRGLTISDPPKADIVP